ncbi:MAG: peroxiredoxin family protein [Ignavibacteriaceae bacterium]
MVGHAVENFRLSDQNGQSFDLYENLDKNILLIFYPKDNSRVCTRQLDNYQKNIELFENKNIRIIGINIDNLDSHKNFCEEIGIGFPLLVDENKDISRLFGALNLLGMNKRKIILIGTDKKILYEENVSYLNYPTSEDLLRKFEFLNI